MPDLMQVDVHGMENHLVQLQLEDRSQGTMHRGQVDDIQPPRRMLKKAKEHALDDRSVQVTPQSFKFLPNAQHPTQVVPQCQQRGAQ